MVPSEKPFRIPVATKGFLFWSDMEAEPRPRYQIREATLDDALAIRTMHAQSWRDTYQNDDIGVTEEWLIEETNSWLTDEGMTKTVEFYRKNFSDPTQFYRIAEKDNEVVGLLHLSTKDDGTKHLWGLYTAKETHGTGLAQQLINVADWWIGDSIVDLDVATYNARAIRFYEKNGFEAVPGGGKIFRGKIPTMIMERKGDTQ